LCSGGKYENGNVLKRSCLGSPKTTNLSGGRERGNAKSRQSICHRSFDERLRDEKWKNYTGRKLRKSKRIVNPSRLAVSGNGLRAALTNDKDFLTGESKKKAIKEQERMAEMATKTPFFA